MARDIAEGHLLATDRLYLRMTRVELERLGFEMEKRIRELRSEAPALEDHHALRLRNHKIQRLQKAKLILRSPRVQRGVR